MDELINEYEDIQQRQFMLNMCDHWDSNDYKTSNEYHARLRAIEKELKEKYNHEI